MSHLKVKKIGKGKFGIFDKKKGKFVGKVKGDKKEANKKADKQDEKEDKMFAKKYK